MHAELEALLTAAEKTQATRYYRIRCTASVRADLIRLYEFLPEQDAPAFDMIRNATDLLGSFP